MLRPLRKRGTQKEAFGHSCGGFTCKVHALVDARGRPLQFNLTGDETADCKAYEMLMNLAERQPKSLLADKGYDSNSIRYDLKKPGIKPVIPPKSNRIKTIRYNKKLYKTRNSIERHFGFLKQNRRITTRYDKTAAPFFCLPMFGCYKDMAEIVHF
jgi:transposase